MKLSTYIKRIFKSNLLEMDIFKQAQLEAKEEVEAKTGIKIPDKKIKHAEKQPVYIVEFA